MRRPTATHDDDHHQSDDAHGEREVRDLHDEWFAASTARDIETVVSHIATDVVSYEHELPLRHLGVEQVRAVCQRGFDAAPGDLRWTVPDLDVLVRDDLAVAWGINVIESGPGTADLLRSRGTRVFRRRDGRWKLVHQHVSFPFDPATGEVRTDLTS